MFHIFGEQVNARYMQLAKGELFTVDIDLQPIYLAAFPEGTNPSTRPTPNTTARAARTSC